MHQTAGGGLPGSGAMRLARTMAQLRPAQAAQRLRLRAQRTALNRGLPIAGGWLLSGPDPRKAACWPAGYQPLDALVGGTGCDIGALRAGKLRLLGMARAVATAPAAGSGTADWPTADWEQAGAPLLWRFHLYYWDWAWALARSPDGGQARAALAAIWESWHAAVPAGRGPAWHPYPAALRAWSWCGLYEPLVAGGPVEEPFLRELAVHAGFLRRNLETDVGGNHLIKNLKALAGLALFFSDEALLTRSLRLLRRELRVQVLPDGGHYERAPAYHCQVLGDLLDIGRLLRAAGRAELAEPAGLAEAIAAMRGWLGVVATPAGDPPMLNDGFPVSRELLAGLAPAPRPGGPLHLLPDTGIASATAGSWHLLADVGLPCPRELPAHAHADTLSCLVHVDGEPLLVDTGTSTYAAGAARDRERSTAAHNTLEVDGRDSTEVWGAFRAGRRARPRLVAARAAGDTVTVQAAHDGYRGLAGRPVHHRRWTLTPGGLRVDDTVTGGGQHRVVVRWHLAPGAGLRLVDGGAEVTTPAGRLTVRVTSSAAARPRLTARQAQVSAGFSRTVMAPVLACELEPELPVQVSTVWRQTQPRQEAL